MFVIFDSNRFFNFNSFFLCFADCAKISLNALNIFIIVSLKTVSEDLLAWLISLVILFFLIEVDQCPMCFPH